MSFVSQSPTANSLILVVSFVRSTLRVRRQLQQSVNSCSVSYDSNRVHIGNKGPEKLLTDPPISLGLAFLDDKFLRRETP